MSQPRTVCEQRRGELVCSRRDSHGGKHYDYYKDRIFDDKGNEE